MVGQCPTLIAVTNPRLDKRIPCYRKLIAAHSPCLRLILDTRNCKAGREGRNESATEPGVPGIRVLYQPCVDEHRSQLVCRDDSGGLGVVTFGRCPITLDVVDERRVGHNEWSWAVPRRISSQRRTA